MIALNSSCIGEILSQRKEIKVSTHSQKSSEGYPDKYSIDLSGSSLAYRSLRRNYQNKLKATSPETETEARRLFETISTDSITEKIDVYRNSRRKTNEWRLYRDPQKPNHIRA